MSLLGAIFSNVVARKQNDRKASRSEATLEKAMALAGDYLPTKSVAANHQRKTDLRCASMLTQQTQTGNVLTEVKAMTVRWFQIEKSKLNSAINRAKAGKLFVQPTSQFRMYVVTNRESGTRYIVNFARGGNGAKLGRCTCAAQIVCKHIAAALPLHIHIAKTRAHRNQLAAV